MALDHTDTLPVTPRVPSLAAAKQLAKRVRSGGGDLVPRPTLAARRLDSALATPLSALSTPITLLAGRAAQLTAGRQEVQPVLLGQASFDEESARESAMPRGPHGPLHAGFQTPRKPRISAQASALSRGSASLGDCLHLGSAFEGSVGPAGSLLGRRPGGASGWADGLRSETRLEARPAGAGEPATLALLTTAIIWHGEAGKQARCTLWRRLDAPSSTGLISADDVNRWIQSELRLPTGFRTQHIVQRMFAAASGDSRPAGGVAIEYIRPGIAFWRILLLVRCYVHVIDRFRPSGGCSSSVDPSEFTRVAGELSNWGVLRLSARQADEEARSFGDPVRFDELCSWAMDRLLLALKARPNGAGGVTTFRDLEHHLGGVAGHHDEPRGSGLTYPSATPELL